MAFKIGNVTVTRRKNYDKVKYYLANQILIFHETRVPSTRELSLSLDINKSSISRALLQLCEDDHWIEKIDRGSARNSYYIIIATFEQCLQYENYYTLPERKKRQFKKMYLKASQNEKEGQRNHFPFGTKEGAKYLLELTGKYM